MNEYSPHRPFQHRAAILVTIMPLLICLLLLASSPANAGESIRITGTDGTAQTWAPARIKEVLASDLKAKHTANAIPLLALLEGAGVPVALKMDPKADPKSKNYNLRLAVVIEAGDGYTATFSLAELMPEIGGKEVWLALDEDGKPLTERDGLARMIVPSDKMPARWVRDVVGISVVDPAAATTRPATQRAGG